MPLASSDLTQHHAETERDDKADQIRNESCMITATTRFTSTNWTMTTKLTKYTGDTKTRYLEHCSSPGRHGAMVSLRNTERGSERKRNFWKMSFRSTRQTLRMLGLMGMVSAISILVKMMLKTDTKMITSLRSAPSRLFCSCWHWKKVSTITPMNMSSRKKLTIMKYLQPKDCIEKEEGAADEEDVPDGLDRFHQSLHSQLQSWGSLDDPGTPAERKDYVNPRAISLITISTTKITVKTRLLISTKYVSSFGCRRRGRRKEEGNG
ncbi:hypothetical protein EYF80_020313 [Liparis tanakae]|uniref:Uncharacterized protein n=1 Tax=Liparis tanakae TaxID=230148 RepID=A0A4Z2HUH4_9TELE|nr:hypothetical protein EYF80_020313 [Liparis tanakae]